MFWKQLAAVTLQHVVPKLLEALITDDTKPSVTTGMVKDFEAKVGVSAAKRAKREARRKAKFKE